MKKNESSSRNGEDRKGFWRIGYLENQDYPKRMMELTRKQVDHSDIDAGIEKAREEKREQFFNEAFKPVDENQGVYGFYPTGQRGFHKSKEILGGFYRMNPQDRWKGVYLEQDTDILKQILANQRKRSALEDYTYIYEYTHIAKICNAELSVTQTTDEWANHIGELFIKRQNANEIYAFPTGSFFKAEPFSSSDPERYYWMERNDKPGAKQKGFGLSLVSKEQLLEKWSDFQHKFTLDRLVFSSWEAEEHFVAEVANTAMPENWGRLHAQGVEGQFGNPVLKSYLEYTLIRLRHLDAISPEEGFLLREGDRIYYNTGLLNKFFRQILVGAHLTTITQAVPGLGNHTFEYYYDPYIIVSGHESKFPTEDGLLDFPKLAVYFEKKEDVLYDASLEIMLNDEHIFEDGLEEGRIPLFREEYQAVKNNPEEVKNLHMRVQARVQIAIQRARLLAERNHKLAVPQFWKETGEVQFLLPLYMEETEYTGRPQCALALRRAKNGSYYEGATILSLDMAYNNARLIAKPDVTWLNRGTVVNGETSTEMSIDPLPMPTEPLIREEIVPRSPIICEEEDEECKQLQRIQQREEQQKTNNQKKTNNKKEEIQKEMGLPSAEHLGKIVTMTDIVSRPSGKGLRGTVLGSTGTVARKLLKQPVPQYTGGTLKVKIAEINPQGNQYLLEPVE